MARPKLIAGNWKMNGLSASATVVEQIAGVSPGSNRDVLLCPPFTLIAALSERGVALGGQDCHWEASGAHTGDVSAEMLADAGATAVILGHSERRADHGESDEMVLRKTAAAWRAGLLAIVCVGETEAERDADATLYRTGSQLAGSLPDGATGQNLVIAYEPVWAIGTGRTPSIEEIGAVHDFIRNTLVERYGEAEGNAIRILYGGSVKPANAADVFAVENVDGALVGGASLKAEDFGAIIAAAG